MVKRDAIHTIIKCRATIGRLGTDTNATLNVIRHSCSGLTIGHYVCGKNVELHVQRECCKAYFLRLDPSGSPILILPVHYI